jgi:broad specificity phosphatase PhoE
MTEAWSSSVDHDIIFARHGESRYNALGLINADPAVENPLSPLGVEQAEELRSQLSGSAFDVAFTSELLRAR